MKDQLFFRKLRKLYKKPLLFFKDSFFFRKVRFFLSEKKFRKKKLNGSQDIKGSEVVSIIDGNIIENANTQNEKRYQSSSINILTDFALRPRELFSFVDLANYIYSSVNCFTILSNDRRQRICVLSDDLTNLYEKLAELSVDNDFIIEYYLKGKLTRPKTYSQLLDDLGHRKVVDLQVRDIRRHNSVILFSIESWDFKSNTWVAPRANNYSRKLVLSQKNFQTDFVPDISSFFDETHEDEIDFDIDIVYTWVNSEEEAWKDKYRKFAPQDDGDRSSLSRFKNREELKYSLRSVDLYAPWVRKIFIVSNCAPPSYLDLDNSKIVWVYHEEIIEKNYLPTFNSHAIETSLHKIKGLSDYFIYLNDDCFFAKDINKDDFFLSNGIAKLRFEPYGMVHGVPSQLDPDYLNAARNGQKLIEKKFFKTVTQLHTHSPQAMNKNVLSELEKIYRSDFLKTRSSRFRSINDISVTSFLYQHYIYLIGKGIKEHSDTVLIKQNARFLNIYSDLLSGKEKPASSSLLPLSFCINDGNNSHLDPTWNHETVLFLEKFFSKKASFER